jgi:ABC-type Fe3+-citrate transport system substrate-binding protein
MSKRVTLSVQDGLHAEMEKWKEKLNFSGIFQEAISKRIRKEEEYKQRLEEGEKSMEETIERLKKEKSQFTAGMFEKAEESGFEWAKNAAFQDLFEMRDVRVCVENFEESPLEDFPNENAKNVIVRTLRDKGLEEDPDDEDDAAITDRFVSSWVSGYERFWWAVSDKI